MTLHEEILGAMRAAAEETEIALVKKFSDRYFTPDNEDLEKDFNTAMHVLPTILNHDNWSLIEKMVSLAEEMKVMTIHDAFEDGFYNAAQEALRNAETSFCEYSKYGKGSGKKRSICYQEKSKAFMWATKHLYKILKRRTDRDHITNIQSALLQRVHTAQCAGYYIGYWIGTCYFEIKTGRDMSRSMLGLEYELGLIRPLAFQ